MKKIIICALAVLLICVGCKSNNPVPTASIAPNETSIATATATATIETEVVTPSVSSAPTIKPTPTFVPPTQWPTPVPTQAALKPLTVAATDAVIIHIKVDTGIPQIANPVTKFNESYQILDANVLGTIDTNSIKMLVYITDYYGNSAVYSFTDVHSIVYFPGFMLSSGGTPTAISTLSSLDIFVDSTAKATLTWGGKSAASLPQGTPAVISNTSNGKTITMTVTNENVMGKDLVLFS